MKKREGKYKIRGIGLEGSEEKIRDQLRKGQKNRRDREEREELPA